MHLCYGDYGHQHINAALAKSAGGGREWGICTECGMGRVDAADVPTLLDPHREILELRPARS
jgi:hypothetical protein